MKAKIFEFIKKVQAISHTGVTYSQCPYALDNYKELLDLSTKMIHEYMQSDVKPYDVYHKVYYPTPQPCVRIVILKDNKVLMVQEKDAPNTDVWTLPGGWCDVDNSPVEAAVKEVHEEVGFDVRITKMLGVFDRNNYAKSELYNVYNIVFLAEIIGGEINPNYEVNKAEFFDLDRLPEFSNKMSKEEFDISVQAYKSGETYFE